MNINSLSYPKNIIFKDNAFNELANIVPQNSKILLVIGKHFQNSKFEDKFNKLLSSFEIARFAEIHKEAPLDDVEKLIEFGRNESVTTVIAIGGGSVIDSAKVAAALIPTNDNIYDYFYGKKSVQKKGLFFIAIPTTAGTGAELTKNSVLVDKKTKIKKSIRHITMIADIAIIDAELTITCPPDLTAASGLDALTQAIESFVTKNKNETTQNFAKSAIPKIYNNLLLAYNEPGNMEARKQLVEGSLLSAMSFSQSGLGAVHGLAHPLGSLLNIPHGVICAILLVPVLKLNLDVCKEDFAELAKICGMKTPEDFISSIEKLCEKLQIPPTLKKYNLKEKDFEFVLEHSRSNSMNGNPKYLDDETIINLLKSLRG